MDHSIRKERKQNPRDRANLCSLLTFFYMGSTFRKALKKDLEEENLYETVKSCNSKRCGDKIEHQWCLDKIKITSPSAFRLLCKRYGKQYIFYGFIELAWLIFRATFEPEALSNLIGYFSENSKLTKQDAYYHAAVFLGIKVLGIFYLYNFSMILQKFALKVRIAFSSLIYRKWLKLTPSALAEIGLGNIITIITRDVVSFEENMYTINDIWSGALQTIYISYILYDKIGPLTLICSGFIYLILPLQIYLANVVAKWRLKVAKKTDERIQIMQEILSAIKVIKMYTWEKYFDDKVTETRKCELKEMLKAGYLYLLVLLIGMLSSGVAFYIFIMCSFLTGYTLNAEKIYFTRSCINTVQHLYPLVLAQGAEMYAALIRINRVLNAEELESKDHVQTNTPSITLNNVYVQIKDKPILKNITLSLDRGLFLFTGKVGSGKSSLLKTILKDYPQQRGSIKVEGTISYASQDPWLFPSSIKQNILFGQEYDELRYHEVIKLCALTKDLNLLKCGDKTIIADKGINLSKGQQARINLARAVYKQSDIYLLDDPLTSLDNNVQDFIFEKCIKDFLKDKLCIMVSQNVRHFEQADTVITLKNGSIEYFGKPLKTIIDDDEMLNNCKTDDDFEVLKALEYEFNSNAHFDSRREGPIDYNLFVRFFKFGKGLCSIIIVVIIYFIAQFVESTTGKLFSKWIDVNEKTISLSNNTDSVEYQDSKSNNIFFLTLYSIIYYISILMGLKFYFLLDFCRVISLNIHKAMSNCVINAVMQFFDTNFIGHIINRFSQDLSIIDGSIVWYLPGVFHAVFELVAVVIVIGTVHWIFTIPAIILFGFTIVLRQLYMPAGRSLKRLEATTRSPIIGHLNASFEGATTIRAYGAEEIVKEEFDRHQDLFSSAHFALISSHRAFNFVLDLSGTTFVFFIVLWFLNFETEFSAGGVGLVLSQILILSSAIQRIIGEGAELENQMTLVERVLEYTEIANENKEGKTMSKWPNLGIVTFESVNLSYDNELVLKNINFCIDSNQKIGIVGRTGAGKSSIISALFRLYQTDGTITVDNVDIKCLNLDFLRQNVSIIPQDPILFRGTIRSNIDPLNTYSDNDIWNVLEKVNMKRLIHNLNVEVSGNDLNFTTGQKQLLCLARAIIQNNRIVILDEATANMDAETDLTLQKVISEIFENCTVIIIAHRLRSVKNLDKILVLNDGEVVEFDYTRNLLNDRSSYFYKMIKLDELQSK